MGLVVLGSGLDLDLGRIVREGFLEGVLGGGVIGLSEFRVVWRFVA